MLTGLRAWQLVLAEAVLVTAVAGPASADKGVSTGSTTCGVSSCDLSASQQSAQNPRPSDSGVHPQADASAGGEAVCKPVSLSDVEQLPTGERGQWYWLDCGGTLTQGSAGKTGITGAPLWASLSDGTAAVPSVDPRVLAEQAASQLVLRKPVVRMSPVETARQVVGVPSWLWVEPASWAPARSTAAVSGVEVTAVATPSSVTWELGDGSAAVVCRGPGTPYGPGSDPYGASPDCGHIFERPSIGETGGVFQVVVTSHWSVTWSGAGQGGVFPDLTARTLLPVTVVEVQSLVEPGQAR